MSLLVKPDILQAKGCRNASERLLRILQYLTDSVMIDHRIVSGAKFNTRVQLHHRGARRHLCPPFFFSSLKKPRRNRVNEGNKTRILLVIPGDGTFNKDGVPLTDNLHVVTSIVYKNVRRREQLGELCLIDINKFQTSVVTVHHSIGIT